MPINLIQYRGTVGIFKSQYFVFDLKHKRQFLLIHSHYNSFGFLQYACFFCNSVLLFLFLAVFLILKPNSCKRSNNSRVSPFLVAVIKTWLEAWFYSLLLLLSESVELNPGPKCNVFSISHWNLNSMSAHNYAKVFLLIAYIAVDIICISETYLDSNTPSNDNNLEVSGYTFVQTTLLTIKEGVLVFITKAFYLLTFYLSKDPQAKLNMTLKLLLKTLNQI